MLFSKNSKTRADSILLLQLDVLCRTQTVEFS
jgi:hypothetical protein